jgi:diguanylate cyclase (GGDEF)-like protein
MREFIYDLSKLTDEAQAAVIRAHLIPQIRKQELPDDMAAVERERDFYKIESQLNKEASYTDGLTGLGNRKLFDELLDKALGQSSKVAVIFFDIDNFKKFNDEQGHAVGDMALHDVAAILAELQNGQKPLDRLHVKNLEKLGATATACRYGGEEMALVVTGQSLAEAVFVAQQTCRAVETRMQHMGLTVSVGVAFYDPAIDHDTNATVARADAAMYAAKRGGKNQVGVSEGPDHFSLVKDDMTLTPIKTPVMREQTRGEEGLAASLTAPAANSRVSTQTL